MARSEGWTLTLLAVFVLLLWAEWHRPSPSAQRARSNTRPTPRPLKPRTLDDWPACRAAQPVTPPTFTPALPYSQVKSPCGPLREERVATAGRACPKPDCLYYGVTADQLHALVGYGGHTGTCAARKRGASVVAMNTSALRVSSARPVRPHLPWRAVPGSSAFAMATSCTASKPRPGAVGEVLSALAEGLSVGAGVRVFGHGEFTIRTGLTRANLHATSLPERLFQNMKLRHVQLDERCTKTRPGVDALWVCRRRRRRPHKDHRRTESRAAHSAHGPRGCARAGESTGAGLHPCIHQRRFEIVL